MIEREIKYQGRSLWPEGNNYFLKILFSLLMLTLYSSAQTFKKDYFGFPLYEDVANEFFKNYSLPEDSRVDLNKFEKRLDGWWIVTNEISYYNMKLKPIRSTQLWKIGRATFEKTDYPKATDNDYYEQYMNAYGASNFNIMPCYGYIGYNWDVVEKYKYADALPDSILYGEGRVYASLAMDLLNDNSGLTDSKRSFNIQRGPDAMTTEQLKTFSIYQNKAIECFDGVRKITPAFQTIVGKISVKLAHEYMSAYLNMLIYQNREEAKKWAKPGIYSQFMIDVAKNFLSSCDSNAVLFTNGDTDTYPLLYVQETENFRRDVCLLNLSLLNTPEYIFMAENNQPFSERIKFSLPFKFYENDKSAVALIKQNENEYIKIQDWLNESLNSSNARSSTESSYAEVSTNGVTLETKHGKMKWKTRKSYVLRNEIAMLDLIATMFPERSICIASTCDDGFSGMKRYLQKRGMVYVLTENENTSANMKLTDDAFNVYMDKLTFGRYSKNEIENIVSSYRLMAIDLASQMMSDEMPADAEKVLKKFYHAFPDSISPLSYYDLEPVRIYLTNKRKEISSEMMSIIMKNMQANQSISIELKRTVFEHIAQLAEKNELPQQESEANEYLKTLGD